METTQAIIYLGLINELNNKSARREFLKLFVLRGLLNYSFLENSSGYMANISRVTLTQLRRNLNPQVGVINPDWARKLDWITKLVTTLYLANKKLIVKMLPSINEY